jgi:catechol 2,3-dioxygenase-like lactoylglutathione lyase family enzyme
MAETQEAGAGEQASTVDPFAAADQGRADPAPEAPPESPSSSADAPPAAPAALAESDPAAVETAEPGTAAAGIADAEAAQAEAAEAEAAAWPAVTAPVTGDIHHLELWVPNLDRAILSWGWLLTALGYRMFQDWPGGRSWRSGSAYIVVEQSPARTASRHDRCRPGLNHLAFHVETRRQVDELTAEALLHGWKLMFTDLHPFAGGPQHYAAYLENADGFEAELVAG